MARRITPSLGKKPDMLCREALMLELAQEIQITEGPEKGKKFRKLRLVARALVNSAIKGDTGATKEIFDRVDGKVTLKVAGDPDAPIKHEHAGQIDVDVDADATVTIVPFEPGELAKLTLEEIGRLYVDEISQSARGKSESETRGARDRAVPPKRRVPPR